MKRALIALAAVALLQQGAQAQFGNEWVSYSSDQARLGLPAAVVSNSNTEVDFAWADLDKNGWIDLVIVRKTPVTSDGPLTNLLMMNYGGTLQDRTAQYASLSSIIGDNGFQTPVNDRDIAIGDLNNDGWLDMVTAPTLHDGDPKHIGHPRVYMNLGVNGAGQWNGFRHEDGRIPQLMVGGMPVNPRFCAVAIGDVTGDGFADLYFGDYDSGPQPHDDMNDRLLVNNGSGSFTDQSSRMTSGQLQSAFGMAVAIVDMNLDGELDIVKDSALNAPQKVLVTYNDDMNVGNFPIDADAYTDQPYHVAVGDLNNDGRPDLVITDDASDRFIYNLSTDLLGRVNWGPSKTFDFLSGGDDGFGGNNMIVDLDGDGWNDVIITDVDVDIAGCGRRTHFYHNPGGAVGSQIDLVEEREQSSGGWLGVKGLLNADLEGTHDVAIFDIDKDGDLDMILGRCTGTFVWTNDAKTPINLNGPRNWDRGRTRLRTQ